MIEDQINALERQRRKDNSPPPAATPLPNGGMLITIPEVSLGPGWNRDRATVIFVAPPGYPAAQPDCFWVEPDGLRLEGGGTPQNTNDANPIPGDVQPGRRTTWFSWHLQSWDPNSDSLLRYFKVITQRLQPAR